MNTVQRLVEADSSDIGGVAATHWSFLSAGMASGPAGMCASLMVE